MGYQAVFKRYELKYMVTAEQKALILKAMQPYMEPDRFGRSTVRNIYFDTDDFILARHSIAKPDFKEKLRIRCYAKADADSTVFVELKRKFDGVVYKRRVGLSETDAMKWMAGANDPRLADRLAAGSPQVTNEIEYFKASYSGLKPVLYLAYDREAYRMKSGSADSDGGTEFRVTFDSNIRCREDDLTLRSEACGTEMLKEGMFLMELKCPGAIPLWMTAILSQEHIYKTSFSKYGTAYCSFMSEEPSERAHMIAAAGILTQQDAVGRLGQPDAVGILTQQNPAGILGQPAAAKRGSRRHSAGRLRFFGRASA